MLIWQVTRAVFVMVARDPLNQGSAVVNPLVCETLEEKKIYQTGEVNKLHRKMLQEESLFRVPPNETGLSVVGDRWAIMDELIKHVCMLRESEGVDKIK